MKRILVLALPLAFLVSSCATLGNLGLKPSHLETVMALKNILDSSTFKAIKQLKNINDGGVDSALPAEVGKVLGALKSVGYGDEVDQVKKSIGQASSLVLDESQDIMSDAIKVTDAVAVVVGGEDAATNILKRAMYATVKKRYSQKLGGELGKTDALKYWPIAAGAYNMFAKNKVDGELSDFLAERAVDGLFLAVGKQEAKARHDYKALGNSVVTKVFDYYTKKK